MDGFLPHLKDRLRLNSRVAAVSPRRHTVTLADGTELRYEHLVSTMPLPVLIRMMGEEAPAGDPRRRGGPAARLRALRAHRRRPRKPHREALDLLSRGHRVPPHLRAGQRQPALQPAGRLRPHLRDHLLRAQAAAVRRRRADRALHRRLPQGGICSSRTIPSGPPRSATCRTPTWSTTTGAPTAWRSSGSGCSERDILLAGRYSEWEYYNSDHAFIAGKKAAEQVKSVSGATARGVEPGGSSGRRARQSGD